MIKITTKQIEEANADRLICKATLAHWRKRLKKAVELYDCLPDDGQAECARLIGEAYLQIKAANANHRAATEVYRQTLFIARKFADAEGPTEHDSPARLEQVRELPSDDFTN